MCMNKLHVSTYSTIRFTLRFVNFFVEVSRVCAPLASPLSTSLRLALATLWYTSLKLTRSVIKLMPAYSLGWISNPRRYQCIASFSISLLLYSDSTNLSLQIRPHRQRLSGTSFSFVFKDFIIIS